jgi:hypothetical protein
MKSILYVSKAQLGGGDAAAELERLVGAARDRNFKVGVTGMLVFTGDHFAQVLEGPAAAVELIMASIRRDGRHHSITEYTQWVTTRSFAAWSLGYEGDSPYVDGLIASMFGPRPDSEADDKEAELRELMLLLALSREKEAEMRRLRS